MKRIVCFVLLLLPFFAKAQQDSLVYREHIDSLIDKLFRENPEPLYRFIHEVSYEKTEKRQASWMYYAYITSNGDSLVCFTMQYLAANFAKGDEQYITLNGNLVYAGSNRRIDVDPYTGIKKEEKHLGGIEYYFRNAEMISSRTPPYGYLPRGWDKPAYALEQYKDRQARLQVWLKAHPVK